MYLSQKSKYFASWNIEKHDICACVIQGYLVQVANLSSEEVRMIGDLLNENSWMYTALTEMLYEQANLNDNTESVTTKHSTFTNTCIYIHTHRHTHTHLYIFIEIFVLPGILRWLVAQIVSLKPCITSWLNPPS